MTSSSCSSSASMVQGLPLKPHQVFINFRGELRGNFISHLETALNDAKINYYIDREEVSSEPIEILFDRIDESDIALAVFSKRYSESKWCLDELERIMKNVAKKELRVIPIFFDVTVDDVKNQKGEFGMNFYNSHNEITKMMAWKEALKSAPKMMALILANFRSESDLIANIVASVKDVIALIEGGEGTNKLSRNLLSLNSSGNASSRDIREPEISSSDAKTNADSLDRNCTNSPVDSKVKPPQIQVFINFRGDLRNYFIGYLVDALRRSGIKVFIDTQANRGDDLTNLFKRIENSGIAIVVFSSSYSESNWCLEELVKIKEREHNGLLKVLPIFYKVTPINVKRLKGDFGDHFRDKEYMFGSDNPKIKQWKEAIAFVSHKFALVYDEKSPVVELDFVATIVEEVLKMLQAISTVESGQSSG